MPRAKAHVEEENVDEQVAQDAAATEEEATPDANLTAFEQQEVERFDVANEAGEARDALATEVAEALADPDFEDPTGAMVPGSSMSLAQAAAATGVEVPDDLGPLGSTSTVATYTPGVIPPLGTYSTSFYPPTDFGNVDPVQGDNITGWTTSGSTPNRVPVALLASPNDQIQNRITEQDLITDAANGGTMTAMGLRVGDPLPPENNVEDLVETDGKANLSVATYGTFEFKDYCRRGRAPSLSIIAAFRSKYPSGIEAPVPQT